MPDVRLDESVTPAAHRAALVAALRAGRVDNRFHYADDATASRWQALAVGYSPAHDAGDGLRAYDDATLALIAALPAGPVHLLGVACGDGTKERRVLGALCATGCPSVTATAIDVSVPLATQAADAMGAVPGVGAVDAVCVDIVLVRDLAPLMGARRPGTRVVTLFGALSTLGVDSLMAAVSLLGPGDLLVASGNMLPSAPGARDAVMAQYDNPATREWLGTALGDMGLGGAGPITFRWAEEGGAVMVVGEVTPSHTVVATAHGIEVSLPAGVPVRVFESHRTPPGGLSTMLAAAGLIPLADLASPSAEEGVAVAVMP